MFIGNARRSGSMVSLLLIYCTFPQAAVLHVVKGEVCEIRNMSAASSCPNELQKCSHDRLEVSDPYIVAKSLEAEIGYKNRLGQTKYRRVKHCNPVSTGQFDLDEVATRDWLEVIAGVLSGDRGFASGSKRLKPGTESLVSMPRGDVLLQPHGVLLDLGKIDPKEVRRLTVYDQSRAKRLLTVSMPKRPVTVAAAKLRAGDTYRWTIDSSNGQFEGTFHVVDPIDQNEVEAEIKLAMDPAGPGPGAIGKMMMRASVYHDYGLYYDRDQTLKQAMRIQQGG